MVPSAARDGTETDIDCGGYCAIKYGLQCDDGEDCLIDSDCKLEQCPGVGEPDALTCVSCFDQKRNGRESDEDCGDIMACHDKPVEGRCPDGKRCWHNNNCEHNRCDFATGLPPPTAAPTKGPTFSVYAQPEGRCSSCFDKLTNGGESDTDCGTVCAPGQLCPDGDTCFEDADCESFRCYFAPNSTLPPGVGVCVGCNNKKKDGDTRTGKTESNTFQKFLMLSVPFFRRVASNENNG